LGVASPVLDTCPGSPLPKWTCCLPIRLSPPVAWMDFHAPASVPCTTSAGHASGISATVIRVSSESDATLAIECPWVARMQCAEGRSEEVVDNVRWDDNDDSTISASGSAVGSAVGSSTGLSWKRCFTLDSTTDFSSGKFTFKDRKSRHESFSRSAFT